MEARDTKTHRNSTRNTIDNNASQGAKTALQSATTLLHPQDIEALRYAALFAQLRASELAPIVWPHAASTASACVMARRVLSRLVDKRMLVERMNAIGTKSYVLTPRGAEAAETYWGRGLGMWVDEPRGAAVGDGYDIATMGPCFAHRAITTLCIAHKYLARIADGYSAWGEFAIDKGWGPATRDELKRQWHKLPDALGYVPIASRGNCVIDWIECESSIKPSHELKKVLGIAWQLNRPLSQDSYVRVGRLVVAYNVAERHEQRIIRTVLEVAREHATEDARSNPRVRLPDDAPYARLIDLYERELAGVELVRMKILAPLRFQEMETVTLLSVLREKYPKSYPVGG